MPRSSALAAEPVPPDRWQHAVQQAAATLQAQHAGERLTQAINLVLAQAVLISPDGVATVRSGTQAYHVHPDEGCLCPDSQYRTKWCKHVLAVALYKRATTYLQSLDQGDEPSPSEEMAQTAPANTVTLPAVAPPSTWQIREAPAACTLKFVVGGLDILYTMRDATDRILSLLQHGVIPWQQPWTGGWPRNLVSGRRYREINVLLLSTQPYTSPYWLSFPEQVNGLGGRLRKGEHVTYVVLWKPWEVIRQDENVPDEHSRGGQQILLLRYYKAVNVEQCTGIDVPPPMVHPFTPLDACEQVMPGMPERPAIVHEGTQAAYVPA
jgi:hypothetical protein